MSFNRREFLRAAGLTAAGLSITGDLNWALPHDARPRTEGGKRVLILGAGLAGLAAAWELKSSGHDVTILEAQAHPGGRVHTIREGLSDDLYAEAGAGRIPQTHSVTLEWVKRFGLELEPFYPTELAQVAFLKGKRVKLAPNHPVDMSLLPLDLTPDERRVGLEKLDDYYFRELATQVGDKVPADYPPEIARFGNIRAEDFLRQKGASKDAIHYMLFGFEDDAIFDFVNFVVNHNAGPLMKIKGGNDQLPKAFAARLSDIIHYGCAVEQIERREDGVRISCRHAGMLDHLEGDAVICTIPYPVLRHIAVNPEWSPAKRKVIDGVYYGPTVRTTFQVSRRYWEDEGLNGFGTSDKNFEVWHPTYGKPGKRGLLQSYAFENYAHQLDKLSQIDEVEQQIRDMDEVHPGVRPNLETVVTKSWEKDPWQRGAFLFYGVGQLEWFPEICRPEGRIWIAGEHASPWPGWMQGAITSGINAARQINAEPGWDIGRPSQQVGQYRLPLRDQKESHESYGAA